MADTTKAEQRLREFFAERNSADTGSAFVAESPAEARLRALEDYRAAQRRSVAGFGPLPGAADLNWSPLGPIAVRRGQAFSLPVVSGRVRGIGVSNDGQRIYVGTGNGGVWRSTDAGREWEPTSDREEHAPTTPGGTLQQVDSLACGALALVDGGSQATDLLYVGTGEGNSFLGGPHTGFFGVGMLRSTDGGGTWTKDDSSPNLAGAGVFALLVDPDDPTHEHAVAVTTQGVFRRRNRVNPWQQETLPGLLAAVRCSGLTWGRTGPDVVFYVATATGQVFLSQAGGAWTAMTGIPAPGVSRVTLAASASSPTVLYALACRPNGHLQGVHRLSTGDTPPVWRTLTTPPAALFGNTANPSGQGNYDQAIIVDPRDENLIYLGGASFTVGGESSGAMFRCRVVSSGVGAFACNETVIGGSVHGDIHTLTYRPGSSSELWLGCDGGVFVAGDARFGSDKVFEPRNTGLTTYTLMGLDHLPDEEAYAFCGVQDNGGIRWLGGDVWDHQLFGDGGATVVNHKTKDRLLSGYFGQRIRRAKLDGKRYDLEDITVPTVSQLFYPPLTASPGNGDIVFFGGEKLYVSTDFGGAGTWDGSLPAGPAGSTNLRSLLATSDTRVYAGWNSGHFGRYDLAAGVWTYTDFTRAATAGPPPTTAENRAITGITADPARADGSQVYVCVAGFGGTPSDHVWRLDTLLPAATRWTSASGTAPNALIDIQHNAILADPGTPGRLWAAADLGVWVTDDSGANWRTLEGNLPDAAVVDLDLLRIPLAGGTTMQLLRASTHGRGVYEMRLDQPQPRIELLVRANDLDQRRRDARAGVTLPGNLGATSVLDASPDIYVDLPDAQGNYAIRGDRPPIVTELVELPAGMQVLAAEPGSPVVSRIHVVVRNRGVDNVDDVRVTLLVGPTDKALPATYVDAARTGAFTATDGWFAAGSVLLSGLHGNRPKVATFGVSSESLPPLSESGGKDYHLVALVHHASAVFTPTPAGTTDPTALVTSCAQAAMRKVTVTARKIRPAPPGGSGLLVPMGATVLTHQRLTAIKAAIGSKVATAGATVHPVERRVLAMATAGLTNLEAGPKPRVDAAVSGAGVGTYAFLGALGFQLPDYTGALLPGGGWVGQHLRRGTGDPHLSHVAVATPELPLQLAKAGLAATSGPTRAAVQAFSTGMLAGVASNVLLAPQLADLLARDTNADWDWNRSSRGAAALDHHLRQGFLGGATGVTSIQNWLPPANDVPAALWEQYVAAIGQTYGLPTNRDRGFGAFEADFDAGFWLTPTRLRNGYGVLLDDARSASWSAWPWWGLLVPFLVAPSVSLIAARSLPHARAFFEGGELTDRAYFETLTASMGIGALTPFVYSMILWGKFDDHTEAFVTALLMGLARLALVTAGLATAGDEGQGGGLRWGGLFLPLIGADVYAAFRAALDSGRHPGNAKVMALQTIPAMTGLTTLGLAGLARAIGGGDTTGRDEGKDDLTFWLLTLGSGALFLTAVGIPVALALSGSSVGSWFLRDTSALPMLGAVEHAGADPARPSAAARVFEAGTLWPAAAPGTETDRQGYPAGTRPLVRLWYEGEGSLSVRYGADKVTFKLGAAETEVALADPVTATSLAAVLQASLAGVKAEVLGADEPPNALPLPPGLANPADLGPLEADAVLSTAFVRVPTQKGNAIVLREAPRARRSAVAGNTAGAALPFPLLPTDPTTADGAGLGTAADLGALLVTAAAPTAGGVAVADALPALPTPAVGEVMQVFRRWNLDERRVEEWQSLVVGHGVTPSVADPVREGQNTLIRRQPAGYAAQAAGRDVAEAMGWLPLWRAWLTVAADATADAGAAVAHASTPTVTFPAGDRIPTNSELTDGVRFLLDLGAT